ncbi:unnamed protein product [Rotaria magnacalcarata]|uniref:UBR-type domain-containing protein n=1 Tax=Rotaria magnacalcarata TaxID=392030 RepID=A0A816XA21_9BILA|nr:unnamed protein product [Rotaria magnacalcarata]CAF2144569.1 unnamed protein product [Rotaria magnacalcarata]
MSSIRTTTDEQEPTVTCSELLEKIQDEEEELDHERARYGNCDVDTCIYSQGYVRRQALFACITCNSNGHVTGICAACAYHCHANHEMNELYTKRCFRCDCGYSKLIHQPCKLYPTNDDEMRQYIICPDWFHGQHLGVPLPMDDNQMDIICQACVSKYSFLANYDDSHSVIQTALIDNNAAVASNNQPCLLSNNTVNNSEKLYDDFNLTPIFDDEDAIEEYQKQALAKSENLDADNIIADSLENLGYVRKLEVLSGIPEFKKSLGDFLREKLIVMVY